MAGENPSGAGNQQERPSEAAWLNGIPDDVGHYIAGFVEGEGSFNVPIRRSRYRSFPWRVAVSFNVSQIGPELPEFLRSIFGVGTVRGRGDGVFYYEVTQPDALEDRVFPFFERFPLRGPKRSDLMALCQITRLVQSGAHRSREGIERILKIRSVMNRGGKRRYSDDQIRMALASWESPEAIRQPTLLDGRSRRYGPDLMAT
jgi:hypothetical protein